MRRAAIVLLCCAGLAGCKEFAAINPGVCQNRILEAGEDCDSADPRCTTECRISCTVDDEDPDCPAGSVCGGEQGMGLCRRPSGRFTPDPIELDEEGARWLSAGDFDDDGRDDLVMQFDEPDIKVAFFDSPGVDLLELFEPLVGAPAIGDLTADGRDELFVAHEPGDSNDVIPSPISLWRGADGRNLQLGYFATLRNVGSGGRLLSAAPERDRIIELLTPDQTKHWSSQEPGAVDIAPVGIGGPGLGTHIAVADLDGGQCEGVSFFPRNEVALATQGDSAVRVASTCGGDSGFDFLPDVQLPDGRKLGSAGAFFGHGNGDAVEDLITQSAGGAIHIAYGVGDGSFDSDPTLPGATGDGLFDPAPLLTRGIDDAGKLLAVADFDGDGQLEIATEKFYYSDPESCAGSCTERPWDPAITGAVVVDINGDGRPDIATIDETDFSLRLSNAVPGPPFSQNTIDLAGPGKEPVVGDFNRDAVPDVALIEEAEDAGAASSAVVIVYGQRSQGPVPSWVTEQLGPFVEIDDLVVEQGSTLVAHTRDLDANPAGAFIRRGEPEHNFGLVIRSPAFVNLGEDRAIAAVLAAPAEPMESIGHFAFVGGSLSPEDIRPGDSLEIPAGSGFFLLTAPIDLDRDGFDELVVLGSGTVWVAAFDRDDSSWRIVQRITTEETFARRPIDPGKRTPPGGGPGSVAAVGDVDGDGDHDLIATTDLGLPKVLVFRNRDGSLDPNPVALILENKPAFKFEHIVPWHSTAGGVQRWLVAGEDGVGVADIDLAAREIFVNDIDDIDDEYTALTTGDLDGDGLLDLIVATDAEVRIHLAEEQVGTLGGND